IMHPDTIRLLEVLLLERVEKLIDKVLFGPETDQPAYDTDHENGADDGDDPESLPARARCIVRLGLKQRHGDSSLLVDTALCANRCSPTQPVITECVGCSSGVVARCHCCKLTRTIFFPARRVNSVPSFTFATRSVLSSPSSFTAFCFSLRKPSVTLVASPVRASSLSSFTCTLPSLVDAFGAATSSKRSVTTGKSSGVSSFWNMRDQSLAACSAASGECKSATMRLPSSCFSFIGCAALIATAIFMRWISSMLTSVTSS